MSHTNPKSPAVEPSGSGAFQTILRGRKCYRVSKDKNEVVWPPQLEAALMEGLEKYTPAESKSPRGLSRFPNRNKFISQYIMQKTGQIRSAKQVGSRIQQLRDTSAGKHIMKAISERHYEMMHPTRQSPSEQQDALPAVLLSASGASTPASSHPPVVQVFISVPPPPTTPPTTATWAPAAGQPHLSQNTQVNVVQNTLYEFVEPRLLRTIDPTVTFASASPLSLFSRCNVYRGSTIVHVGDTVMMSIRQSGEMGIGGYLHYTNLAPGYWTVLCGCDDLSQYTIMQEITKQSIDSTSSKPATVMHVQYQFVQGASSQARPLSPFSLNQEFDYDDSGSDIFPLFPSQALSTGSESPLPSDRSSSPSHSIPTGFSSQPLSPIGWVPQGQDAWTTYGAGPSTQLQQFPTSAFSYVQQPQVQQQQSFYSQSHHTQQPPPPGQFFNAPF